MMRFACVDGQRTDVCSIRDRGFQFGDGVFETMVCLDGVIADFEAHWSRLALGCERLGIDTPGARDQVQAAAREWGGARAVLKLVVTRGRSDRGYRCPPGVVPTWALTISDAPERPAGGVRLKVCRTRVSVEDPQLAGLKHLNRLPQVLARREWDDEYHDGIMMDADGCVIESCASNLFFVSAGVLVTPDLERCGVRGIVRARVIEHASRTGLRCDVRAVALDDLARADEVFLTNSVHGILPVTAIERQPYGVGPVTSHLVDVLARSVYFAEPI